MLNMGPTLAGISFRCSRRGTAKLNSTVVQVSVPHTIFLVSLLMAKLLSMISGTKRMVICIIPSIKNLSTSIHKLVWVGVAARFVLSPRRQRDNWPGRTLSGDTRWVLAIKIQLTHSIPGWKWHSKRLLKWPFTGIKIKYKLRSLVEQILHLLCASRWSRGCASRMMNKSRWFSA